eukprot:4860050-Alexandrium_andersonii.AAC.1
MVRWVGLVVGGRLMWMGLVGIVILLLAPPGHATLVPGTVLMPGLGILPPARGPLVGAAGLGRSSTGG